jgi:predicted permease
MQAFDKYGWVIVVMAFVMLGAQLIRALIKWAVV